MVSAYSQLTIGQYDKISSILSSDLSPRDKDLQLLSLLSGLPVTKLLSMPVEEVESLQKSALFLSTQPSSISLPKSISYSGFTFRLKFEEVVFGQYMDFHSFQGSLTDFLHIILVPEGHTYLDGYEVDFSDLPADLSISIIRSFVTSLVKSTRGTLRYFRTMSRLRKQQSLVDFLRDMDSHISQLSLPL